jgi:hypothetical protein
VCGGAPGPDLAQISFAGALCASVVIENLCGRVRSGVVCAQFSDTGGYVISANRRLLCCWVSWRLSDDAGAKIEAALQV